MTYYLDTNIISYLLEGRSEILQRFIECASSNTIKIPSIVYYEIRRGLLYKDATKQLKAFENFCQVYGIEDLSHNIIQRACEIYAELKKAGNIIEDADILIGATALENNAILVTNNLFHLRRIHGLIVEEWQIG